MSMIPDCRVDDVYNEDFLNESDKDFIAGADWMLDEIVNLFENNLEAYEGRLEYDGDIDIDKVLNKAKGEISEMIKDWAEMERNEIITGMIDNMDEKVLKANRNEILKANAQSKKPKEYYNSRKYAATGIKECTEDIG